MIIREDYRHSNPDLLIFMIKSFLELIETLADKDIVIRKMIADAVTKEGEKLSKMFGMQKFTKSDHLSTIYEVSMYPPGFAVLAGGNSEKLKDIYESILKKEQKKKRRVKKEKVVKRITFSFSFNN